MTWCRSALICAVLLTNSLLCGQTAATTIIGKNFTGSTFGIQSFALPADCNGAVGPSHFIEFINGRFSAYVKTNAAMVQTMTDKEFWRRAGVTLRTGWQVSDPRTVYDRQARRWFAVQIDLDPSNTSNSNHFLLAISKGADPTGPWSGLAIAGDTGANNFADFPTMGVTSENVLLSGDIFNSAGSGVGSTLLSIPKTDLLNTPPSAGRTSRFSRLSYASRGNILQPAVCLDDTPDADVLGTAGLGFNFVTGQFENETVLVASRIRNSAGGPTTIVPPMNVAVPAYTAPLNPVQPDGSDTLDDGDCRFSATVYRVQGILYAVNSTQLDNRASVRWYRIDAATSTLIESGTISDPSLDLFYPSIAANTNGTIVIAFNGTDTSTYISCYAVVGQTVGGSTSFGNLLLLKQGQASYSNIVPGNTISRWGDYSATSVDPADPTRFWTFQSYASGPDVWSTQITELLTAPSSPVAPSLAISSSGTDVVIVWPVSASSFELQYASTLDGTSPWLPVAETPSNDGQFYSVVLPVNTGQSLFRLQQVP